MVRSAADRLDRARRTGDAKPARGTGVWPAALPRDRGRDRRCHPSGVDCTWNAQRRTSLVGPCAGHCRGRTGPGMDDGAAAISGLQGDTSAEAARVAAMGALVEQMTDPVARGLFAIADGFKSLLT